MLTVTIRVRHLISPRRLGKVGSADKLTSLWQGQLTGCRGMIASCPGLAAVLSGQLVMLVVFCPGLSSPAVGCGRGTSAGSGLAAFLVEREAPSTDEGPTPRICQSC